MENTFECLQQQLDKRLNQLNRPQNIHINRTLSQLLDQLDVPLNAKLACLSIDTSMKHLDHISYYHYERDAILIGDLLSAHYYQLLADLKDVELQLQMSQAIVKINELKSYIQHQKDIRTDVNLKDMMITIETLLIQVLMKHYRIQQSFDDIRHQLIQQLDVQQLSYLIDWQTDEINDIIIALQNYTKSK
ncbi:hypothetical protein GC010_01220 [Staphylococcus pseudintermedius]|nr:hypothetical protein [Staphylococcus pseudintermedius]